MRNEGVEKIFFDLDGTLINPRKRLYTLFIELSGSSIGYDDYWKYKDKGLNQRQMLRLVDYRDLHQQFSKQWMKEIERQDLLLLDEVFDDVHSELAFIKSEKIKMYIVTNRQSYIDLEWELEKKGINDYFDEVITTYQRCSKDEAVLKAGIEVTNSIFVGDSNEDMDAATTLGIQSVLLQRNSKGVDIIADYYINDLVGLRGILL